MKVKTEHHFKMPTEASGVVWTDLLYLGVVLHDGDSFGGGVGVNSLG